MSYEKELCRNLKSVKNHIFNEMAMDASKKIIEEDKDDRAKRRSYPDMRVN